MWKVMPVVQKVKVKIYINWFSVTDSKHATMHTKKSKSNPSNITTPFNINTMNTALGIKHLLQNSQCTRIKHTCYKCCDEVQRWLTRNDWRSVVKQLFLMNETRSLTHKVGELLHKLGSCTSVLAACTEAEEFPRQTTMADWHSCRCDQFDRRRCWHPPASVSSHHRSHHHDNQLSLYTTN